VLHAVCCLLYVLVRRMAYSLCVVCCTGLCSHSVALQYLQHLQHLQRSAQPTSRWYRTKLCVISPYNYKCREPYYNILRAFCEVEYTHAQKDDAPSQHNHSLAHETVSKWRQVFWVCPTDSRKTMLNELWKVTGCLFMETCRSFLIYFVKMCQKELHFSNIANWVSKLYLHYYQYILYCTYCTHT
jgi:hypothetical protein